MPSFIFPPRVLLVDHAPIFGGAESFLIDLVSGLDRQQFTPLIVTAPGSPVLEKFRATGAPVLTTPLPQINRTPLFPWRLLRAGQQLAQLARANRADLIHTFTARAHLIGAVAARLARLPLLWRLGDDTLPPWLLQFFAPSATHIVGVSHWLTTQYPALRFDGLVPDGARPPLAISQAEARAELNLAPGDFVIGHIGRLVRWKGQATLIRALGKMTSIVPNARALIVGTWNKADERPGLLGGGESYYRDLQALAAARGVQDRVTFAGFIRDPGVAYAAADIVVHSSILPEPFGRVVIEAMLAGRPVVAAKAGALPEIICDGESGFLTPPDDDAALAAALHRLAASPELRAQISAQGRMRVETEFSLARMVDRMQTAYHATLAANPKTSRPASPNP